MTTKPKAASAKAPSTGEKTKELQSQLTDDMLAILVSKIRSGLIDESIRKIVREEIGKQPKEQPKAGSVVVEGVPQAPLPNKPPVNW